MSDCTCPHEERPLGTGAEIRARFYLRSKYGEYLWHSTVAHSTEHESIRERRTLRAFEARNDAERAFWIITGRIT